MLGPITNRPLEREPRDRLFDANLRFLRWSLKKIRQCLSLGQDHISFHAFTTDCHLRRTHPVPPRRTLALNASPRSRRRHRSLQRYPRIRTNVRFSLVGSRPHRPRRMGGQQQRRRIFVQQTSRKGIFGNERTEDHRSRSSVGIRGTHIQLRRWNFCDAVVRTQLLLSLWKRSLGYAHWRRTPQFYTIYAFTGNW